MSKQEPVDEPGIEVDTRHIRPLKEEQWVERKPAEGELTAMATTIVTLKEKQRRYEFAYGYDAYFMTIKNANSKSIKKWINPSDAQKAMKEGKDVSEKASLVGVEGHEIGSGHKVNLMCANSALIDKYTSMLNTQHRDIRFVVFTDKNKSGASSTTNTGDRPANIDMVGMLNQTELEEQAINKNRTLEEFRPDGQ